MIIQVVSSGLLAALIFLASPGRSLGQNIPKVEARLISGNSSIQPGNSAQLALTVSIEPGWHIYWKKSGDAGLPTQISIPPLSSAEISEWRWPRPEIFEEAGNIVVIGYKGEATWMSNLAVSPRWPPGEPIQLKGELEWLACKDSCIPGKSAFELSLPVGNSTLPHPEGISVINKSLPLLLTPAEEDMIFSEFERRREESQFLSQISANGESDMSIWVALLFALAGGLLLNIMPCVLPVLSIKALRLVRQREISPRDSVVHALFYLAGVIVSFTVLGLIVVGIKLAGQEIGWGFQFQEPRFLVFMTAVVFTFGFSLLGIYEFSFSLPPEVEKISRRESWVGPFGEGLLATILATPCTAPLLGPAIGYAFSQSPVTIMIFFWLIGLGLALPFVLFSWSPRWAALLPKPGKWMETFKKVMAFPLFATGIWLLWILSRQTAISAVMGTVAVLVFIGLGLWAVTVWGGFNQPAWKRWLVGLGSFVFIIGAYLAFVEPYIHVRGRPLPMILHQSPDSLEEISWKPFSVSALKKYVEESNLVFVDFTADWCLTCQVNKRNVLESADVADVFNKLGVVALRGDWTNRDEEITMFLRRLGRSGVPVYVIFKKGDIARPIVLPEILTKRTLLSRLKDAAGEK